MILYIIQKNDTVYGGSETKLFNNYHSGGGLVVVAESWQQLLGICETWNHCVADNWKIAKKEYDVWDTSGINVDELSENDMVGAYAIDDDRMPAIYPFPDAGCC